MFARMRGSEAHSRVAALDAVRGVAALLVVGSHLYSTIYGAGEWGLIWGRPSVMVFYVLSGYVLTLSLAKSRDGAAVFALRRIIRIWTPFAVAILAAAALSIFLAQPIPQLPDWFNSSWRDPVTPTMVIRHLLLIGRPGDIQLDNVAWSLIYEIRISLIFPALLWSAKRSPFSTFLASIALYLVAGLIMGCGIACHPYIPESIYGDVPKTAYFVPHFIVGILCALHKQRIGGAMRKIPWWVLVPVSLSLLDYPNDLALLAGAFLIVAGAASGVFDRVLLMPLLLWLGRVSYSLYLTHLIVILTAAHAFFGKWPIEVILAGAFLASLLIADLFYRLIERPAQNWAKRLVRTATAPAAA
jgi:peptidoglycan/LPS O-acetylase OafA/YrhL